MSRQHQQERSEAVKQMILQAALNIGLEEGNENVTVRRIGERIGYSTGVIYYHFKDKQDILDELARQLDREAYETVKSFIDMDKHSRPCREFAFRLQAPFHKQTQIRTQPYRMDRAY